MNQVASQGPTKLGVAFIIGFVVSLWSANAGIKSIFDALNLVYDEPEKRGFIRLNLISLGFTVAAILFILIAIGCIAALPAIFSSSQFQGMSALVAQIVRWPVLFIIIAVGLAFVYRYGPSRTEPQWRWITWGSALAAIAWIAIDWLFVVRRQLRQLQQDLWIAGRSRHPNVLALALGRNHPDRRGTGCRNGASDGKGYNG